MLKIIQLETHLVHRVRRNIWGPLTQSKTSKVRHTIIICLSFIVFTLCLLSLSCDLFLYSSHVVNLFLLLSFSSGGHSPKKVGFNVPVFVHHWSTASKHPIDIYESISLAEFLVRIRSAFAEELSDSPRFTLYAFRDGVPDFSQVILNIKEYRVTTDDELARSLSPFYQPFGKWPELYIFNEEDEKRLTTPTQSPSSKPIFKKTVDEEDDEETLSTTSRDSATSRLAKLRDNCQCVICGLMGIANLEGCHVYEIKEFDGLASSVPKDLTKKQRRERLNELKQGILDSLGLNTINDVTNLDTMCRACHECYDHQDISIAPSRHIIISNDIRDKVANPYNPKKYIEFHGMQLPELPRHKQVTDAARAHRLRRFVDHQSVAKKFYCCLCPAYFDSETKLSKHKKCSALSPQSSPVERAEIGQLIKSFGILSVDQCVEYEAFKNTDAMKIGKAMKNCLRSDFVQFLKSKNVSIGKAKKEDLMLKIFNLV